MPSAFWIVGAIAGAAVVLLAVQVLRSWLRLRGTRAVTCPETGRKVGVALDAGRIALKTPFTGESLRLASCTRWPERRDCGQECLGEIAQTREGCLVRSILTAWYAGKRCASCGKPIGEIDWTARKPGLLDAAGASIEWSQIQVEQIDEVLASHKPVCFACHMTNLFMRTHPELVVDRSTRKG